MYIAEKYMVHKHWENVVIVANTYKVTRKTKDRLVAKTVDGYEVRFAKKEMGKPKRLIGTGVVFRDCAKTEEEAFMNVNKMLAEYPEKVVEDIINTAVTFTDQQKIDGEREVERMSPYAQRGYKELSYAESIRKAKDGLYILDEGSGCGFFIVDAENGICIADKYRIDGPLSKEEVEAHLAETGGTVYNSYGDEVDYAMSLELWDDELRQKLMSEMSSCDIQEIFDAYAEAHEEKFGEEFISEMEICEAERYIKRWEKENSPTKWSPEAYKRSLTPVENEDE